MHFELMWPSKYLKAVDLQGRDVVVEIEKVYVDVLRGTKGEKEKKVLMRFKGKEKAFVCNITNARAIAACWGDEVNDWLGKRITLFVVQVEGGWGRGMVDAIRVRNERPRERAAGNGRSQTRTRAPADEPPPDDAGDAYEGPDDVTGTEG